MKINIIKKIESSPALQSVGNGMVKILPILLIGSFAMVLKSLPIPIYQQFLTTTLSNSFLTILDFFINITFGMFAIYIVFAVSTSYIQYYEKDIQNTFAAAVVSFSCYGIIIGVGSEGFNTDLFGVKGTFSAIFSVLLGIKLYLFLLKHIKTKMTICSDGSDLAFNNSINVFFPVVLTISIFAIFDLIFVRLFNVNSFHHFTTIIFVKIFEKLGTTIFSGLVFIILSNLLWFFGIHGANVLEDVASRYFTPVITRNAVANFVGLEATEICSKTFFDVFVLMGGCGSTLCLLLALLFFSKRKSNIRLSKLAIFPMIFNINEIMVFGLPIILNSYMFIPFLLTPIVNYIISYCAMVAGFVPVPIAEVNWTTPILIGGYLATNSIRGSILQFFNLIVGMLIYMPFVKKYDLAMQKKSNIYMTMLINKVKQTEETHDTITFIELEDEVGSLAKNLALDLKQMILSKDFKLYYQPQYNNKDICIGVEALLRWKHPTYGMIYPPLVIKLAEELNMITTLEKIIIEKVFEDAPQLIDAIGDNAKISVNVTVATLQTEGFEEFLQQKIKNIDLQKASICLEITEQMALRTDTDVENLLTRIRQMGYKLAIDDFSMGHTSLKYLQTSQFDIVKLDGSIVKAMLNNSRSKEIIASIVYLSQSLGFSVLAEYVETEEQRNELELIGCLEYQGYLFGQAVPLAYFTAAMRGRNNYKT